jgi:hypothetical protein
MAAMRNASPCSEGLAIAGATQAVHTTALPAKRKGP